MSRDSLGRTALHKAAKMGFTEIAGKLLNGDLAQSDFLAKAVDKVWKWFFIINFRAVLVCQKREGGEVENYTLNTAPFFL